MNVEKTHDYFKKNNIIALRADKGDEKTGEQVNQLLVDLGNPTRAIPFYALYPPGGGDPVLLDGLISADQVIKIFEEFKAEAESNLTKSKPETVTPNTAKKKVGENRVATNK